MSDTARPDPRSFWPDADQVGKIVGNDLDGLFTKNQYGPNEAMKRIVAEVTAYYNT